jgi:hypothetical protein
MNSFHPTKESEIPEFHGLTFWEKRKERIKLGMNDPSYQKAQMISGTLLGAWLGLSNFIIGMIVFNFVGMNLWALPAIILFLGANTYLAIRLHQYIHLNHQTVLAYRRQIKAE